MSVEEIVEDLRKKPVQKFKAESLKNMLYYSVCKEHRRQIKGSRIIAVKKNGVPELVYLDKAERRELIKQAKYLAEKGSW